MYYRTTEFSPVILTLISGYPDRETTDSQGIIEETFLTTTSVFTPSADQKALGFALATGKRSRKEQKDCLDCAKRTVMNAFRIAYVKYNSTIG